MYLDTRARAREQAIARGEAFPRRKARGEQFAALAAQECERANSDRVRFFPRTPHAAKLAAKAWGQPNEVTEDPLVREEAIASVRQLNDSIGQLSSIIARWKAPSMEQQLASQFKAIGFASKGRDQSKALRKMIGQQAAADRATAEPSAG